MLQSRRGTDEERVGQAENRQRWDEHMLTGESWHPACLDDRACFSHSGGCNRKIIGGAVLDCFEHPIKEFAVPVTHCWAPK